MPNPIATLETSMGTIKAEIFLDQMPRTASNFIDLANSGFYNGMLLPPPPCYRPAADAPTHARPPRQVCTSTG